MPLGQSRIQRITQSRTNGVHFRESTGTGQIVLKVVPVTGVAILQVTMDQLMCASLFPYPVAPVAQRYHVTSDTLGREFDPGKRDFSH